MTKLLLLMTNASGWIGSNELPSSALVRNLLEKGFSSWNHLVLAVESCKECTSNNFWQIFSFWGVLVYGKPLLLMIDASVQIGSKELCLLWKCKIYLRGKIVYVKRTRIGCIKFQRRHPEPFLTNFWFFEWILV